MKFSKTLLTLMVGGLLLAACSDKAATGSNESSATTTTSATSSNAIKVATDATYPPFEFRSEKGEVMGIEADLLKAIGESEGFAVDIENNLRNQWQNTLGKPYDVWASAFYDNGTYPEADMSKPFMQANIVLAVNDDRESSKSLLNTGNLMGKKIAVSKYYGEPMIELAKKLTGSAANVMVVDTFYLSARELYANNVDAVLGANYVLAYYAKEMEKMGKTRLIPIESEPPRNLVFLVKKGNTELLNKINSGIDKLQANGTLKSLQDKWLPK